MGNTYEISIWRWSDSEQKWHYLSVYRGESFFKAIYTMWKLKRQGVSCVKFEWR